MNTQPNAGFTIIELILVLAITAALAVGILGGSTAVISQQRYKDSVNSLENLLEQQYVAVTRVVNDERSAPGLKCTSAAKVNPAGGLGGLFGSAEPRGTSDCELIGRVINVTGGGKDISVQSMVGHEPASWSDPRPTGDVAVLSEYKLGFFPDSEETSEVTWGARIVDLTGVANDFGVLLLRSPESGNIVTFVSDDPITVTNAEAIVDGATSTPTIREITMCVDSDGLFTGLTQAVVIRKGAASPAGVEQLGDDSGC